MEWKKNLFCFLAAIMGLGGVLPSLTHWTSNAHVIVTEAWKSEIKFRWIIRAAVWVFFLFMVIKRVLVAETCITTSHSPVPPPTSVTQPQSTPGWSRGSSFSPYEML